MNGFEYDADVIKERTGTETKEFLSNLADFIKQNVTEEIISEDLNVLLPYEEFIKVRAVLKREVLTLIQDEINRV